MAFTTTNPMSKPLTPPDKMLNTTDRRITATTSSTIPAPELLAQLDC